MAGLDCVKGSSNHKSSSTAAKAEPRDVVSPPHRRQAFDTLDHLTDTFRLLCESPAETHIDLLLSKACRFENDSTKWLPNLSV